MASWPLTPIGGLCTLVNGRAFKPSDWGQSGLRIVRIQNLNDDTKPFNLYGGSYDQKHFIDDGAILLSWSGTPGTSFGCFRWSRGPAILNQHIFRVHVNEDVIDGDFFIYAVNAKLDEMIGQAHGGVGLRHITKGKLEAIRLPVPALAQQRRVVAWIRGCLARVEEIERLRYDVAKEQNTVLASARHDAFTLDAPLYEFGAILSDGPTNGLYKHAKFYGTGTRILRIDSFSGGDVFHEGAELRRLTVDEAELRRYSLQVGDIVLNRVNGSLDVVGKACLIASLSEETVFESNMMRFVVDPKKAEHRYVLHFLGSPNCRDQIKGKAKVIQQASINQKDVASLVLPLPQVAEQRRIADRLDKVRAVVEGIRTNTADQESSTSMLRESILRKAFAGEL